MNHRQRKKWLKQRHLYVDPKETWDLTKTIATFVLPRLRLYQKISIAYPGKDEMDTEEKWDEALTKMIRAFELLSIDDYGLDFVNDPESPDKYKVLHYQVEEGLALFTKWFEYLGW